MARWLSFALLVVTACASGGVTKSARWAPYPGCNARQCQTWYDECSAECISEKRISVTECENKCRAPIPDCEASCTTE